MIAALLLFTVLGSSATAAREELAGSPASPVVYRVSGVVVNSRGAPIPRCTLRLFPLSPEEEERENPGREDRGNGRVGRPGAGRQSDPGGDGSGIRPRGGVGQDASQTTLSDAQGHFSLVLPHGGRWLLSGVARDFRQQRYQQHDAFSTALVLSEQAPALRVEFALKASNSILGSVLDEFGDPVQGGQVVAQRRIVPQESGAPLRWQSGGSVQTDDRGHYELTGLADGVYRLAISAHPWYASGGNVVRAVPSVPATPDAALDVVFPVTWFPGSTEERSADLVSLHGGEEREADFHLQSVPALHITLPRSASPAAANEDGARPERGGIPEITRLTAGSLPFGGGGQFTSVTRDGNWEIGGLAPGTFQVRLPAGGPGEGSLLTLTLNSGVATGSLENAVPELRVGLLVEGGDTGDLRSVTFTGVITGLSYTEGGRGRPGNRGQARRQEAEESEADERSLHVAPGDYFVTASLAAEFSLAGITATGAQVEGRTVHIADGTPVVTLHLERGRTRIAGFTSQARQADAGAMVLLVPATYGSPSSLQEIRRSQAASDGSFFFHNVPAGPYILVSIAHGWDVDWRDTAVLAKYLDHGTPLAVPSSGELPVRVESVEP